MPRGILIRIEGPTSSGKTTLARTLQIYLNTLSEYRHIELVTDDGVQRRPRKLKEISEFNDVTIVDINK